MAPFVFLKLFIMIRTKSLADNINDVPIEWVFQYYLKLTESLNGQDIKMKSVFNSVDKNPSMYIYYSKSVHKYKFKDFSTSKQGDGVDLVKELFNLNTRFIAANRIVHDYNEYTLKNGAHIITDFKIRAKYKVKFIKLRPWNESDAKYWLQFRIGTSLLEKYNVKPLENFTLYKDDTSDKLVIRSTKIYGYFKKNGDLYKIYQPLLTDNKFFKVCDYIQGADQLTFNVPYLVICSSLKDMMAFEKMGFKNAECIAPDSENVMISERNVNKLKERYKAICTLFDNDAPGIKSMAKYKEQYNISSVHLKMEKDMAENIKIHGVNNTRENLYPVLTKALTGSIKQLP